MPEFIFCSEAGTHLDERSVGRVWDRIQRRAQKRGVRPLKLHCARHAWATLALRACKSVRWVADQLGHSDPALTLRVYAHAMCEEEDDLAFADFAGQEAGDVIASEAASSDSERLYPAPTPESDDDGSRNHAESMARREGFARSLRSLPHRPSGSKKNPNPRKINEMELRQRKGAETSRIKRNWRRQTAPPRHLGCDASTDTHLLSRKPSPDLLRASSTDPAHPEERAVNTPANQHAEEPHDLPAIRLPALRLWIIQPSGCHAHWLVFAQLPEFAWISPECASRPHSLIAAGGRGRG
ncbi:MAG: tyrosine-type recombinase/integrase [Deltaproteobacteria bacterium]|nr:tyrosine-type recombinase/integrase [Deltaproteobacteria bacterium]